MKKSPIKFELQKSIGFWVFFLCIHIGSVFCIYFVNFNLCVKTVLMFCVLVSLLVTIKYYAQRSSCQAIVEFWRNNDGDWHIRRRSKEVELVSLDFPIFISSYLIILNFVSTKKFFEIVVPVAKDAFLVKDDFRKLKVLLKTKDK